MNEEQMFDISCSECGSLELERTRYIGYIEKSYSNNEGRIYSYTDGDEFLLTTPTEYRCLKCGNKW